MYSVIRDSLKSRAERGLLMRYTVAIFGEAERGDFQSAFFCQNLEQLERNLGNPPENSAGMHYAIQSLLFDRNLIFFRVREEGFSIQDYLYGLYLLESQHLFANVRAIGMPGVGDRKILDASEVICDIYKSMLLTTEADLYDFLTNKQEN